MPHVGTARDHEGAGVGSLALSFQEVVHSVRTGNADFAKRSDSRRTEWTPTKMPA